MFAVYSSLPGSPSKAKEVVNTVSTTVSTIFQSSTILAAGHTLYPPVTLKKILNTTNCSVTINGANLTFLTSAAPGTPCYFYYEAEDARHNLIRGKCSATVQPKPPISCTADTRDVTQGQEVIFTLSGLASNDDSTYPPLTVTGVGEAYGGNVTVNGSNVSFVSNQVYTQPAGFKYYVKDAQNNTSTGSVFMNVLPLPPINAYLYPTSEANSFKSTYTPPTQLQIFNSWDRFAGTTFYPGGVGATGEAASWQYNSTSGQVECTVNSATHTGFLSSTAFDNYTHDVTLSSVAADDDVISVIIAAERSGSTTNILYASRNGGGWAYPNWSILLDVVTTATTTTTIASNTRAATTKVGNWQTIGSSRVKVIRTGNVVEAYCSQFGSNTLDPDSYIRIDMSTIPSLAWACAPKKYGYSCLSQQYSTFKINSFVGGADTSRVYDLTTGKVYEYQAGSWVELVGQSIQSILGYPRTVTNPANGKVYQIEQDRVYQVS